jgi:hypothetical protein
VNYRELYTGLSEDELRNVASRARLPIEDVRQEALLRCWQIASGQSDYQPARGTVRQYVMASLWGLATREIELPTVALQAAKGDDGEAVARARQSDMARTTLSVLDAIIAEEEQRALDRCLESAQQSARRAYDGLSTTAVLLDQGISSGRIASLIGVTPQAVRQRVARELTRRAGRRTADGA